MHKLRSYRTVLILMLMLTNFLIHGNAAAQCPNDPCPQQTQSGQTGENPNMNLRWASGNPPSEISPGETLDVDATGGRPPYTWNISGSGVSLKSDNPTDKANNQISADCSASGATTITLSDSKKDEQDYFLNTISGSIEVTTTKFQIDDVKTGYEAISRNSSKIIYIKGGSPPFQWTTSKSGFYFDSDRTIQEKMTDDRSLRVYTDGTACGSADIQITDGCSNSTEGSVRCSAGRWVERAPSCPIPGPKNYGTRERIEGKYWDHRFNSQPVSSV